MIKNIILDVGGILFDDSKNNIEKVLGKLTKSVCKHKKVQQILVSY